MPRNKKGSTGGSRGRNRGRGGFSQKHEKQSYNVYSDDEDMDFIPFAGSGQRVRNSNGLSLASEARRTPARHNWSSETKLRNTKVNFISAGSTVPSEEPKENDTVCREGAIAKSVDGLILTDSTTSVSIQQDTPLETEEDEVTACFVIDTIGDRSIPSSQFAAPQLRSPSPTFSDSSEDVILFTGRDDAGRGQRRVTPPRPPMKHRSADPFERRIRVIDDQIHLREELLATADVTQDVEQGTNSDTPSNLNPNAISIDEFCDLLDGDHRRREKVLACPTLSQQEDIVIHENQILDPEILKRSRSKGRRALSSRRRDLSRKSQQETDEEAIIDDYIANMEEEELSYVRSFNTRDLGGEDDDIWQETNASAVELSTQHGSSKWNREDLCDFDDLSTSDGLMETISAVLSKRERSLGQQYLVVWEDQGVDEARWHYHASLPTNEATNILIEEFEAEEKLVAEFFDTGDGDSEADSINDLDGTDGHGTGESDDIDDEADLVQRHIDRMTDEKIARLLAKQEELGMGSGELVLFDDSEDDPDKFDELNPFLMPTLPMSLRARGQRSVRPIDGPDASTGHFPEASALADAYDGFDIMDFERPSLKRKSKGRKGKMIFDDVSDSELAEAMQMTWKNDRQKKKERKEEREELRAQGLLGRKNRHKPDTSARYAEGMAIGDIRDTIRDFLKSNNTTLALPPMDKRDRKTVHEIGSSFNLKSKSLGGGKKRFPVLYRTQRTLVYDEAMFDALEARITRRFVPRMDIGSKKSSGVAGRGGGFSRSAVGYRDGDVVGSSAPELGAENKGRKMLEMMGWSSGDALGALNNKGILQPITHVVKTTKAGLG